MAGGARCAAPADENGPRERYAAQRQVRGIAKSTLPLADFVTQTTSHMICDLCIAACTHCYGSRLLC